MCLNADLCLNVNSCVNNPLKSFLTCADILFIVGAVELCGHFHHTVIDCSHGPQVSLFFLPLSVQVPQAVWVPVPACSRKSILKHTVEQRQDESNVQPRPDTLLKFIESDQSEGVFHNSSTDVVLTVIKHFFSYELISTCNVNTMHKQIKTFHLCDIKFFW